MRIKLFSLFLLVCVGLRAQTGNFFLSHYSPGDEHIDNLTFAITQNSKGVLFFANKAGVLEFDGRNWNLTATHGPIFTVASWQEQVYAGGFQGFGRLEHGTANKMIYKSLSDQQPEANQIFSSIAINGKIYFLNSHHVYVVAAEEGKIEAVVNSTQELSGLLEIAGQVYAKSDAGILKVENGKFTVPAFPWADNISFDFSSTRNGISLVGTTNARLFLASSSGLTEINLESHDYLTQNTPIGCTWLTDDLAAVATLRGGVVFFNPRSGATVETTNYYTGLPDNEVYALFVDRNEGAWIAHDYGFTRVTPAMPFRSFSHYAGLEGNLLCVRSFQGRLYVGTTLGLFVLKGEEKTEATNAPLPPSPNSSRKKRGLFSFLHKNRSTEPIAKTTESKPTRTHTYAYRRVDGVEGKVVQLLETDGQLLAAGNFGIARVDDARAKSITQTPVRSVFKSASVGQLLVSTQDDEITTFKLNGADWKSTNLLDTINEYVGYVFEDKLQNIWLCGRTHALKVETVDGEITAVEQVPFSNPTIDESVGLAYGSEVYMATGGSFHRYELKENIFKKYDSLPGAKKYFASAGYFWFHDGHRWNTVDKRMQAALKLEWLSLFSNIRFIAPADQNSLWVITAANELYRFSPQVAPPIKADFPLFLREVHGNQNDFLPSHSVRISQLESTVSFEFIQPDYLGSKAVEYRYRVKGLSNEWSTWSSSNNIVNFSYLPTGNYKIAVQTRDLMGNVSASEEISLEVEPPYWRKYWFYLLEVIFFGAMVYLSIRLSSGNPKYRLVSQLLSMLTIVMIIQLVQAAVSTQIAIKDSPVLDFFLQVAIALLVLPVEGYLRRFILRSTNTM